MTADLIPSLAAALSRLDPYDPLPADTRRALCDTLDTLRPTLTGPAAVAVDVLTADDDTRAGEALTVLHDVRRALHTQPSGQHAPA